MFSVCLFVCLFVLTFCLYVHKYVCSGQNGSLNNRALTWCRYGQLQRAHTCWHSGCWACLYGHNCGHASIINCMFRKNILLKLYIACNSGISAENRGSCEWYSVDMRQENPHSVTLTKETYTWEPGGCCGHGHGCRCWHGCSCASVWGCGRMNKSKEQPVDTTWSFCRVQSRSVITQKQDHCFSKLFGYYIVVYPSNAKSKHLVLVKHHVGGRVQFSQVSAPTAWILFNHCIHKMCIVRIVTQL